MKSINFINRSDEFVLKFNGEDLVIPTGKFSINESVADFVFNTSKKWGMKLEKLGAATKIVAEPIIEETPVEEVAEEVKDVVEATEEVPASKKNGKNK